MEWGPKRLPKQPFQLSSTPGGYRRYVPDSAHPKGMVRSASPLQPETRLVQPQQQQQQGFIYERREFTREEAALDQGVSDGERTRLRLSELLPYRRAADYYSG